MGAEARTPRRARYRDIGLWLAPLAATAMVLSPAPAGLDEAAWRTAAVGVLMAVWWATEALPVAATALLPLVLFPLLGVADIRTAAASYANPLIYLFLGGFFIALALQRWNVHVRLALAVLSLMTAGPRTVIAGFMVTTAFLSMWVSNTATTIMMLPVGVAVVALVHPEAGEGADDGAQRAFSRALMLAIAYSASVGGLATLVGTAPNALLAAFLFDTTGRALGFAEWMMIGLPVSGLMLGAIWLVLARRGVRGTVMQAGEMAALIARERARLGAMGPAEWRTVAVFVLTAVLWVAHPLYKTSAWGAGLSDAGIAMLGAVLMFAIPADWRRRDFLLNWDWARRAPWDVLILFGGGLSLAKAMSVTGLAVWIGAALGGLSALPLIVLTAGTVALVIFLTEMTSNTATTAAFLPVVAAIAGSVGLAPMALAVPAAMAASCAFMLPVATPPNAIIFGAGHVSIPEMMRAGFVLNLVGIAVITVAAMWVVPWLAGG